MAKKASCNPATTVTLVAWGVAHKIQSEITTIKEGMIPCPWLPAGGAPVEGMGDTGS